MYKGGDKSAPMNTPVIPIDISITHVKWGEKTHKARRLVIDMVLGHNTSIKEKGKTTKTTITSTDVPLMDIL